MSELLDHSARTVCINRNNCLQRFNSLDYIIQKKIEMEKTTLYSSTTINDKCHIISVMSEGFPPSLLLICLGQMYTQYFIGRNIGIP